MDFQKRHCSIQLISTHELLAGNRDGREAGVRVPVRFRSFLLHVVQTGSCSHPLPWIPEAVSLRLRRTGREAGHATTANAEIRNA